jgi:hypothetical protein
VVVPTAGAAAVALKVFLIVEELTVLVSIFCLFLFPFLSCPFQNSKSKFNSILKQFFTPPFFSFFFFCFKKKNVAQASRRFADQSPETGRRAPVLRAAFTPVRLGIHGCQVVSLGGAAEKAARVLPRFGFWRKEALRQQQH